MKNKRGNAKIVLQLWFVGYSFAEIYKKTNIPKSTIRGAVHNFRKQLKAKGVL